MSAMLVTSAADWAAELNDSFMQVALRKGHFWLRKAGVETRSDDLALLAYHCWGDMSELKHEERLDDDYVVAGDVLDIHVTDHDAELLCEAVPEVRKQAVGEVGGMSTEVAAVHSVLLLVCGAMREAWEEV